ncbi:addiction module antidote protein [Mannheimia haemolytica]|uniref:addiction module antidote protein n=1 Tax=Mannheimia haemolytica TaxID=75985 RepID=UPI0003857B98|nr:addiction module antidote protein [Mannheimia haemolytica]EPY99037.1 transcriptional regulator [Mannheimia haemolytica D35]MDW0617918.1 putative addiction module antidote protein [Mannheimia haemolytica]MDW1148878.1 putative addiction module antidote protein [Mannheimia haemolytica]MDW1159221.1 putative addiction module antidote protein [Mannheimia haemolytica]NBB66796.1 putative addiction module antidote protein [Mannheimia haemolytica]
MNELYDDPIPQATREKYGITEFDGAEYLTNDELIALYLAETLKDGTDEEFIQALNTVARAKGMNELAKKAGIGRESLYQSLSSSKPRFETIRKIISALNLELSVVKA